jgi:hypothetical protein
MESPEKYSAAQISVSGIDAVASLDEIFSIMSRPLAPDPPAAVCCVIQRCVTKRRVRLGYFKLRSSRTQVERDSTRDF